MPAKTVEDITASCLCKGRRRRRRRRRREREKERKREREREGQKMFTCFVFIVLVLSLSNRIDPGSDIFSHKYHCTGPILIATCFCKIIPSCWLKAICTQPICMTVPSGRKPQWAHMAYCTKMRYCRCDTPYRAIRFQRDEHSPQMVRQAPFLLSFTYTHLCDTPLCNISRDSYATPPPPPPHKNKHKRVLRYYRYKYRAI